MKHRSPLAVFFLSLFTLGIYALVWDVKTKNELNKLGADIPTAWLLIVPFANIYWLWKYCQGVEKVSNGKISLVLSLILLFVLSIVGMAIIQSMYNDLEPAPTPGVISSPMATPTAPVAPAPAPPPEHIYPPAPQPPVPDPPVSAPLDPAAGSGPQPPVPPPTTPPVV